MYPPPAVTINTDRLRKICNAADARGLHHIDRPMINEIVAAIHLKIEATKAEFISLARLPSPAFQRPKHIGGELGSRLITSN